MVIQPIYIEYIPDELEENKFYISEQYHVAIHLCFCGCKNKTVTPLDKNNWTLIKNSDGKISLTPSIGNWCFPCRSHYWINNNIVTFE